MQVSAEVAFLTTTLSGMITLVIGRAWGGEGKVDEKTCKERRGSCKSIHKVTQDLINQRFDQLEENIKKRK